MYIYNELTQIPEGRPVATTVVLLVTVGPFTPKSSKSSQATVFTTSASSQPTDKITDVTASPSFQPTGSTASPSAEPTGEPSFKPAGSSQSTGKPSTPLDWYQKGIDIYGDGEAANNYSGRSVSLSSDGTIFAIGSSDNYGANGYYSGHVRVYDWKADTSPPYWQQRGADINAANNYSGNSVSLSSDGNIVHLTVTTISLSFWYRQLYLLQLYRLNRCRRYKCI
jgi:hypothetical protein